MDTHILKEKSELFVFLLVFIQIAKLLTEHDLSWAFPTAHCYFYCHCQLSFPYWESSLDEDVLISRTHRGTQRDAMRPSSHARSRQRGNPSPAAGPHPLENSSKCSVKPMHFAVFISPHTHKQSIPKPDSADTLWPPLYLHCFQSLSLPLKLTLSVLKTCVDYKPRDSSTAGGEIFSSKNNQKKPIEGKYLHLRNP